ncbi:MAG TPA: Lrp/AsnC family transcriptional regulator [Candidatus Acidoferrales bacterium]|nr:Lrp/AsnC family transcriptional regulator [Candidatus Acidoferrales bacterium]
MTREIDEIDTKILRELLIDARRSFVDIAAQTKLSTVSIGDRFSELEKTGVIAGATIQVSLQTLGHNVVCSVLIKVEKKEIDQVINYIQKISLERPMIFRDPKNDICLIVGLRDINEVSHLKEKIRKNKAVQDLKVETWLGVRNMPENLSLSIESTPPKGGYFKAFSSIQKSKLKLDSIDLQIIEHLTQNSMKPFSKMAKEIGSSINTVSKKYKNLVNSHIIRPVLQINPKKLGYNAMVVFALSFASESEMDSVIDAVMGIKDTFLITKTSGNYDLLVQVFVRDIDQLLLTQYQVANISGISAIEILVYPVPTQWPLLGENISTF